MLELISRADQWPEKNAIITNADHYSYKKLLDCSAKIAAFLLGDESDLAEKRVAYLVNPGIDFVKVQWGIWRAGGVAVPLCVTYDVATIKHIVQNADSEIMVTDSEFAEMLRPLADELDIPLIILARSRMQMDKKLPDVNPARQAIILYYSEKPNDTEQQMGIVSTHEEINNYLKAIVKAWNWTANNYVVCMLPSQHIHGITNVVGCALWSGAIVEFVDEGSPEELFNKFLAGKINTFVADSMNYLSLIDHYKTLPETRQEELSNTLSTFRLMALESMPKVASVSEKWNMISRQQLLTAYGRLETGISISNPYQGNRRPDTIGLPIDGMQVRLVDKNGRIVETENLPGEIQLKSVAMFRTYWLNEAATKAAFTEDGWFRTGDYAVIDNGYYRLD